jgi:hypothetical protein
MHLGHTGAFKATELPSYNSRINPQPIAMQLVSFRVDSSLLREDTHMATLNIQLNSGSYDMVWDQ